MWLGGVVLLAVGIMFSVFSVLIYNGKTELIHSYHQERVKDKKGYGRAMGRAIGVMALSQTVSGVLAFFEGGILLPIVMLVLLIAGHLTGLVMIFIIQKKYNQGLF